MDICFTGHRPDKLGTGYSITSERVVAYSDLLLNTLVPLIENENAKRFTSGGAIGIDQIAFWTVHRLKERYPFLINVLAIPFEKQYTVWRNQELVHWYHQMVSLADEVVYVDTVAGYRHDHLPVGDYSATKMELRNQYMVDTSDKVIAVWNGTSGGTGNCVKYAKKKGKPVIQLHPLSF